MAVRQHKPAILKCLQAEGQLEAETYCGKHGNPRNWNYAIDQYQRPGWRSVNCEFCHAFIGFQPPQESGL